ncbi:hypothetical protein AGMMS49992_29320 [Clostridia bacterium]|nr:hypothetical protein AGMMS49992_29320 [Clostridia bacterium]
MQKQLTVQDLINNLLDHAATELKYKNMAAKALETLTVCDEDDYSMQIDLFNQSVNVYNAFKVFALESGLETSAEAWDKRVADWMRHRPEYHD